MYERYKTLCDYWRSLNIRTADDLENAVEEKGVLFAYHSGKIENDRVTYYDTKEIFDHDGVTSYTGDLRTLFELYNAKQAYRRFLDAFGEGRKLDESLVKEFHYLLTRSTYTERRWKQGERPGEYKHHDYVVGIDEVGALPEDVGDEMSELIGDINSDPGKIMSSDESILTAAAFFHAKFENIHPFSDGNGRTGRLCMNYLLVSMGHPPAVIHEEDRRSYYSALSAWDRDTQIGPLKGFLEEQQFKTWRNRLERAGITLQ